MSVKDFTAWRHVTKAALFIIQDKPKEAIHHIKQALKQLQS